MRKLFFTGRKLYILTIALEAVFANRFRSMLTALGIIFGVAAVIAMLAIGNGARQEILEQMKLVGVNNIIIMPKVESKMEEAAKESGQGKQATEKFSPGLTLADAASIAAIIPSVAKVSPEVVYESVIISEGVSTYGKVSGVTPDFFEVFTLPLERGEMFNEDQLREGKAVCILGATIKAKLFPHSDPVGRYVKCGSVWLKVTGVLQSRAVNADISENLGISDYNNQVYAPIQTMLLRYRDRSVVTTAMIRGGSSGSVVIDGGFMSFSSSGGSDESVANQIDKIVVQVKETNLISQTSEIIQRMLKRRHAGVDDFEIKVPELLLKQEQRTKDIFNIVLGAIASISLIVGGIGIMNIMLASVMERTKEIGIRMATGATRKDVIFQFLSEATLISLSGGIIGIFLGMALAKIIMEVTGILTIVSLASIVISFGVSATVGIAFGYMPARKAAMQDPVTSLRYE
ncbi:ABC transporter permease [Lentimicrobium sp.]|jgi:putative ABC transport system permease protein|uniref:ABC transporter permease n=1 Tax=Lentimicrobium sp. TaxID=2034841 RepID=UPI0025F49D54|nr:ABC transporter permease [Lentimicrobium sp.]MCO5256752.1 ABC transporter permease [Lentimicrobium sp.]HOP12877.1 ABC transporter permease [Lentimicrobium sp.]HPF63331.1 ABC transporter permease [Lentimicrobium sp.]HPR25468.1 ABC transporter permease [Lentimicrobium sp.]HRW68041.1 ABC transporter permease [Lentimicrobium sp.]